MRDAQLDCVESRRDDTNWLKTTRAKYVNGEIKLTYEPVDISQIPPRARRYAAAK